MALRMQASVRTGSHLTSTLALRRSSTQRPYLGDVSTFRRTLSSSTSFSSNPSTGASQNRSKRGAAIRVYKYVIDVHGQLFLHDTVPKNLTSCFKNPEFLNFFFLRLRSNPLCDRTCSDPWYISRQDILSTTEDGATDWSETAPFNGTPCEEGHTLSGSSLDSLKQEALSLGLKENFEWVSPCGPEVNLVRTQDTPVVYRDLLSGADEDRGRLRWAGDLEEPFQADQCKVDLETGYLYHPSPTLPNPSRSRRGKQSKKDEEDKGDVAASNNGTESNKYGKYSLLSSHLVQQWFAESLELNHSEDSGNHDGDGNANKVGGSLVWNGKQYPIGILPSTANVSRPP